MPSMKPGYHESAKKSPRYIIDDILPSKSAHVVAGPSGVGKTSWILSLLSDMRPEEDEMGPPDFLGRKVNYVPHAYITFESTRESIENRLNQIGKELDQILCLKWSDVENLSSDERIKWVLDQVENARLVAIEPLDALYAGLDGVRSQVASFMSCLQWECERRDITILGSMPAAKTKQGMHYNRIRDKIYGNVSWATGSGTVFVVEEGLLWISPRLAPEEMHKLETDAIGGVSTIKAGPSPKKPITRSKLHSLLNSYFGDLQPGSTFSANQITQKFNVSQPTFSRWIKTKSGEVKKLGKGEYQKRKPS